MSQSSNIEWTDATWNPVRGCVKVSPGCRHCYAETFAERFRWVKGHPYEQGFDLRLVPEKLAEPLSWKKSRRVFVNSMSDLFQDGVPDDFIDQVFAVMAMAPEHTFQVLTKRPERMRDYLTAANRHDAIVAAMDMPDWLPAGRSFLRVPENWPLPNVWLGVSVENQHFADERIPLLLQTLAAVRFISAEPLLGPITIRQFLMAGAAPALCGNCGRGHGFTRCPNYGGIAPTREENRCHQFKRVNFELGWVIVGGESGAAARPFEPVWARSIVQQCAAAHVPCFVKQLGSHIVTRNDDGWEGDTPTSWPMDTDFEDHIHGFREDYQGAPVRVRLRKKGGDPAEWPEDLRVREFPR